MIPKLSTDTEIVTTQQRCFDAYRKFSNDLHFYYEHQENPSITDLIHIIEERLSLMQHDDYPYMVLHHIYQTTLNEICDIYAVGYYHTLQTRWRQSIGMTSHGEYDEETQTKLSQHPNQFGYAYLYQFNSTTSSNWRVRPFKVLTLHDLKSNVSRTKRLWLNIRPKYAQRKLHNYQQSQDNLNADTINYVLTSFRTDSVVDVINAFNDLGIIVITDKN